jgi:hypothetical protein
MLLKKERLLELTTAHSRTIQNAGAELNNAGRITVDAREKD